MIKAPHQIEEAGNDKFSSLVESFRTGRAVTAVVVYGDNAICGSHRIHAFNTAVELWENDAEGWENTEEPVLEIVELSDEDFTAASEHGGVDSLFDCCDYNDICAWVLEVTEDQDVIKALADQID